MVVEGWLGCCRFGAHVMLKNTGWWVKGCSLTVDQRYNEIAHFGGRMSIYFNVGLFVQLQHLVHSFVSEVYLFRGQDIVSR